MTPLRMILTLAIAGPALAEPLPPGRVPPPARFDIATHALPIDANQGVMWRAMTLDARLLDAIAPLGDGPANAATWWRELADDGARAKEAEALRERGIRRVVAGSARHHFDWSEPLVQEARASADQARLSFTPDIWPDPALVGRFQPPGLTMLAVTRSWMVHGLESPDPAIARDDFRRMIRLGRLLLQDDVHELQVLFGLNMIRNGLEALYETARRGATATSRRWPRSRSSMSSEWPPGSRADPGSSSFREASRSRIPPPASASARTRSTSSSPHSGRPRSGAGG